jgi:hypothetical protein
VHFGTAALNHGQYHWRRGGDRFHSSILAQGFVSPKIRAFIATAEEIPGSKNFEAKPGGHL